MQLLNRITHDPTVMGGRPCVRGMRVTVGTIMGLLAAGTDVVSDTVVVVLVVFVDDEVDVGGWPG